MLTINDVLKSSPMSLLKIASMLKSDTTTIFQHSDNYVYVDRKSPITLVSHVDTVRGKDKLTLQQNNGIIWNSNGVLGADDRAGTYAMFRLSGMHVNLLFCNHEESGGIGAKQAAKDLNQHMIDNGVKLLIELDRRGVSEYVYYSYHLPKKVTAYIESYGFHEGYGSYSDIAEFDTIPAVNLSIGYYDQHTAMECLVIDEMELTINRVKKMIQNPISKLHKVIEPVYSYSGKYKSPYNYDGFYDYNGYNVNQKDDMPLPVDEFFREPVKWKKPRGSR